MLNRKLYLAPLLLGFISFSGHVPAAETYEYQSGNFFDARGVYTTAMSVSGQFTVDTAFGRNLPSTDIIAQVTSYSFSDGVQTLTQDNSKLIQFDISTNGLGEIDVWNFTIFATPITTVLDGPVAYIRGRFGSSNFYVGGELDAPCTRLDGPGGECDGIINALSQDGGEAAGFAHDYGRWRCTDCQLDAVFTNLGQEDRNCAGDDAGGFSCQDVSPVPTQSNDVALGFLNGDAFLDAVFAIGNANRDQVCLGTGNGGFVCRDVSPDFTGASSVALGFVDGDQNLDAVFANVDVIGDGENRICLGDGNGGFSSCSQVSAARNESQGVALGDVNPFPAPSTDAVFANSTAPSQVCLGDGLGGFTGCADVTAGVTATDVALGHINVINDNAIDAVFATGGGNRDQICLNNFSGNFTCSDVSDDQDNSNGVALGRVDGDSHLDIVFAVSGAANRVCLGDGNGVFSCSAVSADTNDSRGVALGYVDADIHLDAVFANFNAANRVCLGNGDGSFSCTNATTIPWPSSSVALGDTIQPLIFQDGFE